MAASEVMEQSASGRRGVEADEARAGEVRPLHNSIEADEQTWATGDGVGGAKGEDRGKHGRATHVPDTAPDKDVPTAIGVPEDHSFLRNAPELDYSSFCVTIGTGTPAALLRRI
jgi:hypothetical protein